jgi:hypothetical protein
VRLDNQTGYPARILTADLPDEDFVRVTVSLKLTFDLHAGDEEMLTLSAEAMPFCEEPLSTPFGTFHPEIYFRKDGADLCVLGTLRRARPVTSALVQVGVAGRLASVRVTGDRVWAVTGDAVVMTDPAPFTEMPLGYDRAFGGSAPIEDGDMVWPHNPDGRGLVLDPSLASGVLLPNLEPADGPFVARWDDRPPVAGIGPVPFSWGLHAAEAVRLNADQTAIAEVTPRLFNHAHPSLVVPAIRPGDVVSVLGVWERPLQFRVPALLGQVVAYAGDERIEALADIDGVYVFMDAARVVVTQRARFRYQFSPGQRRGALVRLIDVSSAEGNA